MREKLKKVKSQVLGFKFGILMVKKGFSSSLGVILSTLMESIPDPWFTGVLSFKSHVLDVSFIAYVMLKWKHFMLEEVSPECS